MNRVGSFKTVLVTALALASFLPTSAPSDAAPFVFRPRAYTDNIDPDGPFFVAALTGHQLHLEVSVYDALGRRVRVLYTGAMEAEQARSMVFEAGDLPSGLYVIRAVGEAFVATRKTLLLK